MERSNEFRQKLGSYVNQKYTSDLNKDQNKKASRND